MVAFFIKRFLLRIGFSEEGAEAVSAWLAKQLDRERKEMTPEEKQEAEKAWHDRTTPPLNS